MYISKVHPDTLNPNIFQSFLITVPDNDDIRKIANVVVKIYDSDAEEVAVQMEVISKDSKRKNEKSEDDYEDVIFDRLNM